MNALLNEPLETAADRGLQIKSPFVSVWQAAVLLERTEKEIYIRIQEGRLPLAFNIGMPGTARACLRLAASSVVSLMHRREPESDLAAFLERAVPVTHYSFRAPQLARLWQGDYDHVYRLVGAGELEDIGGKTRYRIPRESVIRFLTARRIVA